MTFFGGGGRVWVLGLVFWRHFLRGIYSCLFLGHFPGAESGHLFGAFLGFLGGIFCEAPLRGVLGDFFVG